MSVDSYITHEACIAKGIINRRNQKFSSAYKNNIVEQKGNRNKTEMYRKFKISLNNRKPWTFQLDFLVSDSSGSFSDEDHSILSDWNLFYYCMILFKLSVRNYIT